MSRLRTSAVVAVGTFALLAAAPTASLGHGGEGMESESLSQQPARTLAQQAMSELRVRHDATEAAEQLDAAVESKDQTDVDSKLVNEAMEALDAGAEATAIAKLDQALSRPLGEESGVALHESGREFQPGTDTQEVVAIIVGAALLIFAGVLLLRASRGRAASP